jgi:hypothetical protein
LRKAIYLSLKFGAPAVVFLLPVGAIWGYLHPWPPAQAVLSQMNGLTPIPIGFRESYSYVLTSSGDSSNRNASRTYLMVPSNITWPKVVTISQANEEPPRVSESSIADFLILLITFIAACVSTWWFWLRGNRPNAA